MADAPKWDTTGESLTPEQVSQGLKDPAKESPEAPAKEDAKVDPPVEVKKDDAVPPKEEKKEETPKVDPPTDPPAKPPENSLPKPRSIYDRYKEKKDEVKERDQIIKDQQKVIEDLKKNPPVDDKKPEPKIPDDKGVDDELVEFSKTLGADPEAVQKLADFLQKRMDSKDTKVSKEDVEFVKKFREEQAERAKQDAQKEETAAFVKEWNSFVPQLKTEFPHITENDMKSVLEEVSKLAHSEKYHDKEMDYIWFKEKESLSKLISPKRPSYEGGDIKPETDPVKVASSLSGGSSPMDVMNAQKLDKRPETLEIRSRH